MNLVTDFYRNQEGLRRLLRELASEPVDLFLDVGCQKGDVTRNWRRPSGRIVAIDVEAWQEWHEPDPGISFALASATELPFANDSFDFVVASESLQYVVDRMAAVDENRRVLKPGGRMLLSFPEGSMLTNSLDPYKLIPRLKQALGRGRSDPGFPPHLKARTLLEHCREGWQVEKHIRRGSLIFIYVSVLIDKLQVVRLLFIRHRMRWLAEATLGLAIRALFLVMRLDCAIPFGPLSYNNIIMLRKV